MHVKHLNSRTHEADKKIDQVAAELAEKYGIDPPQVERNKARHPDKEHRRLFRLEALAEFLAEINSLTVADSVEGVDDD